MDDSTGGDDTMTGDNHLSLALGLGLFVIGYIGVFFGHLIKSAVSRQREYLADASAATFTRYPEGQGPACCEVCPREAVIYGKRADLLAEAKQRLADNPDAYVPKVYGETEAGGTQVLYLAAVDFEKLGLPPLTEKGVGD